LTGTNDPGQRSVPWPKRRAAPGRPRAPGSFSIPCSDRPRRTAVIPAKAGIHSNRLRRNAVIPAPALAKAGENGDPSGSSLLKPAPCGRPVHYVTRRFEPSLLHCSPQASVSAEPVLWRCTLDRALQVECTHHQVGRGSRSNLHRPLWRQSRSSMLRGWAVGCGPSEPAV
jgi:hypothetical protein